MYTFEDLKQIMKTLRTEDGCPWDRAQDLLYMTGPAAFVFDGTVTL